MKQFTDSLLLTSQFSLNHGEEPNKLIQRMDSKTHLGNGSVWLSKKRETSVTMVSLKKSTDSLPTISLSYLNHGEEQLKHIQLMVSRTQVGNGSIKNLLPNKKSKTLEIRRSNRKSLDSSTLMTACTQPHTQEKSTPTTVFSTQSGNTWKRRHWLKRIRLISETRKSRKKFMDLSMLTTACIQLHTQEKSILSTESWTQHSNTCHKSKTLETQNTWDLMSTISWMRTLGKFQHTEEKLPQSTPLSQENLDKESTSSQLVQALPNQQPRRRQHSHKFQVKARVTLKQRHHLPQLQRKLLFCNHWNTNTELTPILPTWELLSMPSRSEWIWQNWIEKEIKFCWKSVIFVFKWILN